jgi:hypothetical protein
MPRDEGVQVTQQQIIAIRAFQITYIERCTPMTLGKTRLCLAVLAGVSLVVTGCTNADLERLRGRTPDQVKQACDPQRQTPEEVQELWTSERGPKHHEPPRPVLPVRAFAGLVPGQEPGRAGRDKAD